MRDNKLVTRENRARRAAQRQGLRLAKSRARDPRSVTHGRWYLRGPRGRGVLTGNAWTGATLEEIELYLQGGERQDPAVADALAEVERAVAAAEMHMAALRSAT